MTPKAPRLPQFDDEGNAEYPSPDMAELGNGDESAAMLIWSFFRDNPDEEWRREGLKFGPSDFGEQDIQQLGGFPDDWFQRGMEYGVKHGKLRRNSNDVPRS